MVRSILSKAHGYRCAWLVPALLLILPAVGQDDENLDLFWEEVSEIERSSVEDVPEEKTAGIDPSEYDALVKENLDLRKDVTRLEEEREIGRRESERLVREVRELEDRMARMAATLREAERSRALLSAGDPDKVMDLEARLVHCMITLQGFTKDDPPVKKLHGSDSDMMKLQTYIAKQSNGMNWNPPMDHPLEKAMRDAGEVMFYRRSGTMDFSCQTCHGATGKRIRASVLPNINEPAEWTKAISWPAERAGQQNVRSTQHRLRGCLWQMRYPEIIAGSDASIALISFWTDAARGQPAILPDLKR